MSLREVQAVNIDPAGPVPEPDGNGQVILNEAKSNPVLAGFVTFLFAAAGLVSLVYWVITYESGQFPAVTNASFVTVLKGGVIALPFLPFLFSELLSPPRLSITDTGVALRRRTGSKIMFWTELAEVNLQERVTRDRYGGTTIRTDCRLFGGGKKLVVPPIFGVSPVLLAAYLQTRGEALAGGRISVTQSPPPALPAHVRVQLAVLGILAGFAIVIVLAAYGIMQHSPAGQ
jgi:hypothetical protein